MVFADTDKTVFVGRREDGSLYGYWSVRQWKGQEEMLEDDPEVQAFINQPLPKPNDPKPTSKPIDPNNAPTETAPSV